MKTLYLMRHAKSDRDAPYVGDKQRPLSERGRRVAVLTGSFLASQKVRPELVLCSTALRTRETLEGLMSVPGLDALEVDFDDTIYMATFEQLLRCVREAPECNSSLLVVGHEPTISLLSGQLVGGAAIHFPTGAISCVNVNVESWKGIRTGVGLLRWHITPRMLRSARARK
jgi:phosphohistidine phosphatase